MPGTHPFDESAMKLLDTLQDEHALIDRMLGSLRAYVAGLVGGTADPAASAARGRHTMGAKTVRSNAEFALEQMSPCRFA